MANTTAEKASKAAEANKTDSKDKGAKSAKVAPEVDRSKQIQSLATYNLLGRSGLRVSPLAFGTGTFGDAWGEHWATSKSLAKDILNHYFEAGGNFIDTADTYQNGQSEEITGEILREFGNREQVVIASKFTFGMHPGDPNGGGNGRKHMIEAVNASLRRLGTDYIDLYWVHNWDTLTSAEEVMSSLNNLVQSGKVRYIGLSNPPAWYLGRAQTIAELRGWEKLAAIQMEYSLAVRNIEFEYIDAAQEMGFGVVPWSPLANGLLTGKYKFENDTVQGTGRLASTWLTDPTMDLHGKKTAALLTELLAVAKELGKSPAQVALNWVTNRPGVSSTIIGATKMAQLEDNLKALEFEIPEELLKRLDEVSKPDVTYPYFFHTGDLRANASSQANIRKSHNRYNAAR